MKIHELLEQAHLDALGLLDESEQKAFEQAFIAASPAVQRQVRSEQTRWATTHAIFSDGAPSPALRSKVIDRVMAEVRASATTPEVLATIGGENREALMGVRVSPMWRAAALGFAAAALVAIAVVIGLLDQNRRVQDAFQNDSRMANLMGTFGSRIEQIAFDRGTSRIIFDTASTAPKAFTGMAALFVDQSLTEGRLVFKNLIAQPKQEFRVVLLDQNGVIQSEIQTLNTDGSRAFCDVNMKDILPGLQIAIAAVDIGQKVELANIVLIATIKTG